jgi:hypothetical protein
LPSPVQFDPSPSEGHAPPVISGNPAVQPNLGSVPRTKFRSVALDARFWAADKSEPGRSGPQTRSHDAFTVGTLVSCISMLFWKKLQRLAAVRMAKGRLVKRVLVVGAGKVGRELAAGIRKDASGRQLVGFLDDHYPLGGDMCGRFADLAQVARAEFVDEVIVAIPCQSDLANRIICQARHNRLDVSVVPDLLGYRLASLSLEQCGDVPVLTLHRENVPVLPLSLKRSLDVVFSAAALILSAPLMAVIALLIKLTSQGPILYRARRAGRKCTSFLATSFELWSRMLTI